MTQKKRRHQHASVGSNLKVSPKCALLQFYRYTPGRMLNFLNDLLSDPKNTLRQVFCVPGLALYIVIIMAIYTKRRDYFLLKLYCP